MKKILIENKFDYIFQEGESYLFEFKERDFGKKAVRRNQIVANLLQRVNLVENMGTGINKIRKLLKDYGCKEATFGFGEFYSIIYQRDLEFGVNGDVNQIYEFIKIHPNVKVIDIEESLKIPRRTIERYVKVLRENDLLEFKGNPKSGGYFVYSEKSTHDQNIKTVDYTKSAFDESGGVNGGVNQILDFIKNHSNVKVQDIEKNLKFSKRTIERYIKILREKDLIEFKGSAKTGGYFAKK